MNATLASLPQFSPQTPLDSAVMDRASGENFPVASRLLGRSTRSHLLAIYGFARLVDELGDSISGDRLAALDWLGGELDRAYGGEAQHPLLVALQPTLRALRLPREPFVRLIQANRQDQHVTRYETWQQLLAYCDLSANPVGELVLHVFGLATPHRVELSDRICTALQLTEHWQDVSEDMRAGRIYLPAEDLERFGCAEEDLKATQAGENLRKLLAFQVDRTRALMNLGAPLIATLKGRPKLAVAAFIGGGNAALAAVENAGFDVLSHTPTAGSQMRLRETLRALLRRSER